MKRVIVIAACLFVFFAAAASAWASCNQNNFSISHDGRSSVSSHGHHQSDSHHDHSKGTVIHCATLDEFLLTAAFSTRKEHRAERIADALILKLDSQFGQPWSDRSMHGPPGSSCLNIIPPYLLFSVLRI